jgi:MYXO-CTERM domain-containing protein
MPSLVVRLVPVFSILTLALACGSRAEDVRGSSSAIVNGQPDTTHPAVVALLDEKDHLVCTGTVIARTSEEDPQQRIGSVLTSASCVLKKPVVAIATKGDFALREESRRYNVIDTSTHPGFDPAVPLGGHDLAVVRIAGAFDVDVIRLVDGEDGLETGAQVMSLGFGKTAAEGKGNSKRHIVEMTLTGTHPFLTYNTPERGICEGDGGGPVLRGVGAEARVVGVHYAGSETCSGTYFSTRVSTERDFIAAELARPLPARSCNLCALTQYSGPDANGKTACARLVDVCLGDEACLAFTRCMGAERVPMIPLAPRPDADKYAECAAATPLGKAPYDAALNCGCSRCAEDCSEEPKCKDTPACGFTREPDLCTSCIQGSCCQQQSDCAADGVCRVCLETNGTDERCVTNALYKAHARCVANDCVAWCGPKDGQNGENGQNGGAGVNGVDGKNGIDGKTGVDGKNGKDGKDGAKGEAGESGVNGVDGVDGKNGADGKVGARGPAGDSGCSVSTTSRGASTRVPLGLVLGALVAFAFTTRRRRSR